MCTHSHVPGFNEQCMYLQFLIGVINFLELQLSLLSSVTVAHSLWVT